VSRRADGQLTLSLEATPDQVDAVEESIRPFGIVEVQRTGRVALPRLGQTPASA
jgi:acetolactate synthase-1/3 small subunit